MINIDDDVEETEESVNITEAAEKASLLEENIKPNEGLLVHLRARPCEKLHYLGVSFGLTQELFCFWQKHNFYPFYVGQIPSAVTGEHTCMVLRPFNSDDIEVSKSNKCGFLDPFYQDFRQRFRRLLGTSFRHLNFKLAMSVLALKIDYSNHEPSEDNNNSTSKLLGDMLSPHDMKRLEAYSNNLLDYHLILDLVPMLAHQYFSERLPVSLHGAQAAVLFRMGQQHKDIGTVKEELGIEREQVLSNFIKTMKKLYGYLHNIAGKEIEATLPRLKEIEMPPFSKNQWMRTLQKQPRKLRNREEPQMKLLWTQRFCRKYAIDDDNETEKTLQNTKVFASGIISVKSNKTKEESGKSKRKGARRWQIRVEKEVFVSRCFP